MLLVPVVPLEHLGLAAMVATHRLALSTQLVAAAAARQMPWRLVLVALVDAVEARRLVVLAVLP